MINLIIYEIEHTYSQDNWYSPLKLVINDLTVEQAVWKPKNKTINSIWETTVHLLYYKERLLLRLQGKNAEYTSNNHDTFAFEGDSQEDWDALIRRMHQVNQEIYEHVQKLSITDLENDISKHPLWKHINGVIRHDAHHAGQIIVNRKLQGAWPVYENKNR
ncbi:MULTISPECIES: DinB family protein [unclassified Peribacillus]|uniref:DinB family protein n=1 Tax=unclassified Peribacillus TaxID=2675266 RepID=UPI002868EB37|nr:DinB family protein [Peribacillus sp. R9-11]WMX58362.1 DinB family protein [Peribacillus sp. R9-11]